MSESSAKQVLLVEGSRSLETEAQVIEDQLESVNCRSVQSVEEVDTAVDADCIVCSFALENSDAVDFLERIRSEQKELPFILYASDGGEELASRAISAGVTDYVISDRDGATEELMDSIEKNIETQNEIEAAKIRLEDMLGHSSEALYLKDENCAYKLVNPAGAEHMGLEPGEVIENTPSELFNEEDARKIEKSDRKVLETGETLTEEITHNIHGEQKHFLNTKIPHKNENGDVNGVICLTQDITRRRVEERRMETLFNNTKEVMAIVDTDRTVLKVNEKTQEYLENSREELEGVKLGVYEHLFPENEMKKLFDQALDGDKVNRTAEMKDKHGDQKIMDFSLIPILNDEENVSSVLLELDDQTKVRRNQRQLEAVFNSSYELMALVDSDGEVLQVNKAVEEFFDIEKEDVEGLNYTDLDRYLKNDTIDSAYLKFIKNKYFQKMLEQNFHRKTITVEKPDGQNAILDVSLKPVKNEEGEVTSILAEGREITEMKSNERQLRDQKQRMEKFSSIVSHDLRNPLNVASGYIELAKETGDSEDFEKAKEAVRRMDEIIEELLALSGKPEDFKKEELKLSEIFRTAYSFVDVEPEYSIEGDLEFSASSSGVTRMFENMIRNTVEHNEDASIVVGTIEKGFYYEDDGQLDENPEKITEYGYTGGSAGSGVGLSVVQRVSEIHDWDLNVVRNSENGLRLEFLMKD